MTIKSTTLSNTRQKLVEDNAPPPESVVLFSFFAFIFCPVVFLFLSVGSAIEALRGNVSHLMLAGIFVSGAIIGMGVLLLKKYNKIDAAFNEELNVRITNELTRKYGITVNETVLTSNGSFINRSVSARDALGDNIQMSLKLINDNYDIIAFKNVSELLKEISRV